MAKQKAKYPKLINLDSKQVQGLEKISKKTKQHISEVIRDAIDFWIKEQAELN